MGQALLSNTIVKFAKCSPGLNPGRLFIDIDADRSETVEFDDDVGHMAKEGLAFVVMPATLDPDLQAVLLAAENSLLDLYLLVGSENVRWF